MLQLLFRISRLCLIGALLLVLSQPLQIFPGILLFRNIDAAREVPDDIEQTFITTSDGNRLETWFMPTTPVSQSAASNTTQGCILFHGNGENVFSTYWMQQWLAEQGLWSIAFDFRGYARSSGWPTESGLYIDANSVWEFALSKGFTASEICIIGTSIGTGAAAYLAAEKAPAALVLLSPYISIPEIVADRPFIKYLKNFLWYDFPTASYVASLDHTHLFVAHGLKDTIINSRHGFTVLGSYSGSGTMSSFFAKDAGHNDLFSHAEPSIRNFLAEIRAGGSLSKSDPTEPTIDSPELSRHY